MAVFTDLDIRMKQFYEIPARTKLTRKIPVAIRIDGKAFHTFTRGFNKPFDEVLSKSMQDTMKYLCENIQGCVFGYTQSDEITLILTDYQKQNSDAWFDYEVQKMCSIASSMATMKFNKAFVANVLNLSKSMLASDLFLDESVALFNAYSKSKEKGAMFDARCFNIPVEEIANLIIWRQQDAVRNSIQSAGFAFLGRKAIHKKNNSEVQDMLMEKGINWNDFPVKYKRGSSCIKKEIEYSVTVDSADGKNEVSVKRKKWVIDDNMPVITQNREYVEDLVKNNW